MITNDNNDDDNTNGRWLVLRGILEKGSSRNMRIKGVHDEPLKTNLR